MAAGGLVLILAASMTPLAQTRQTPQAPFETTLLGLDHRAAVEAVRRQPEDTKAALARLQERFDQSVHSARDVPEQRKVQYDDAALDQGLQIARLYSEATGDNRPLRRFAARQRRIEGTKLLNARKPADAVAALKEALAEAVALDDTWLQIITRTNLAYGYLELGDGATAMAECEKANAMAEKADARSHALTMFNLASVHMHLGQFEQSTVVARQAIDLTHQVGNKLWEGNLWLNLGVANYQLKRLTEARSALIEARDVLSKTQDKLGIGRAYFNLALVEGDSGDVTAAVADMERALPIIRSVDIRHSHDIEEDDTYYNSIEEAALQMLVTWCGKLDQPQKAAEYKTALDTLRANKPAAGGHTHKSGHDPK